MKQYMLSVHHREGDPMPSQEAMQRAYKDVDAFNKKLESQKLMVFGGGLMPVTTATVVREKNGEFITTDGPFIEAKEHIGGFWVVRAPDLDAALKLAKEAAHACQNPVEVRPFQEEG